MKKTFDTIGESDVNLCLGQEGYSRSTGSREGQVVVVLYHCVYVGILQDKNCHWVRGLEGGFPSKQMVFSVCVCVCACYPLLERGTVG